MCTCPCRCYCTPKRDGLCEYCLAYIHAPDHECDEIPNDWVPRKEMTPE